MSAVDGATSNDSLSGADPPDQTMSPSATSVSIPLATRLAHEMPKPKDWQAFQRNCVLLFRDELNDPHAQEYGRSGQNQRGIDILARRNGDPGHAVGVQCRLVSKPLKEPKILKDCRAALAHEAGLKEILFATTAPDDTGAADAANRVEHRLRSEGHDLRVVVYGWGQLQNVIAVHDLAYKAFCPSVVSSSAPQAPASGPTPGPEFAAQVAAHVLEGLRETGLALPLRQPDASGPNDEDPALHAKIDTYRDLFKERDGLLLAEKGLLSLLERENLEKKPWARFRIETNLASIAQELGREAEAAARYETAHAVRPGDPKAVANLALARTIQGRFDEAMDLARRALSAVPRADHAVAYLLQAAARSTWQGDPESLIPADLVGSEAADVGLAEFLRRRNVKGWAERTLELSRRHPELEDFNRIRALAVLAVALEEHVFVIGGQASVTVADLNRAADDMKAAAERVLDIGFADEHDLLAYLNNAALLLRLSGRHEECESLLQRGLPKVREEPSLRRILALAQAANGRRTAAIATLAAGAEDPENVLLSIELGSIDDPRAALARALSIDASGLERHVRWLRWQLVAELAVKVGDTDSLKSAVANLRELDPADVTVDLLEIRAEQKSGLDDEAVQNRLRGVAGELPTDASLMTRYLVAEELREHNLSDEAAKLLEGHVDLSRPSPATTLYLQSLAAARRDDAFRRAVAVAAPAVRDAPEICWTVATHAWNVGDLSGAFAAVAALLSKKPDDPRARLLKIEILLRQDRSAELLAELDRPIETLGWTRLQDRFRVAALLGHFGYTERAAALAYRLFLEHRDNARAWMALSGLVLEEGRGKSNRAGSWQAPTVAENVAVDLRYDDGESVFFVVEPDVNLRKLDEQSWEPAHPLVQAVLGLAAGTRFVGPHGGRQGTITQLRHKYVARLHYVLRHYEARFPTIEGFRQVTVDTKRPGGLDEVIAQVRARRDWVEQEQEQYRKGPWPIGVLAHRLGVDVIDVAGGLATQGHKLKVARGDQAERKAAAQAIRENKGDGCVLDLLAFWTAWRLQALDAVIATCGLIHVTQNVMDSLRARRERFDDAAKNDGLRTLHYEAGKLAFQEVSAETVAQWLDDTDRAIAWAQANAKICPLVAGEDLPTALREYLSSGRSDVIDSIVLARHLGLLLITDDLSTRDLNRLTGGGPAAWLHQVFGVAVDQKHIDVETYVRWSAYLIDFGHDYIGASGPALAFALRADAKAGGAPGYLYQTLAKVIGGRSAEVQSHVDACRACLIDIWSDNATSYFREPATGMLLRQLVRERDKDYGQMIRTLRASVRHLPLLGKYIDGWVRGHFLVDA